MKTIFYTLIITLISTINFAQNEVTHTGKIIGSHEIGAKDFTIIFDEISNCNRKSTMHSKNLFAPNESVLIKINDNAVMAEVIKPGLSELVYLKKDCGTEEANDDLVLSENNVLIAHDKITLIRLSLLDLTKNESVKNIVTTTIQDPLSNEQIKLSHLENELNSLGINLLDILGNSLINHGGTTADLLRLQNIYKQFNINEVQFDVFIFVPFSDYIDYSLPIAVSSFLNNNFGNGTKSGIRLNINDEAESVMINKGISKTTPTWILSISLTIDNNIYPALPWQKCHCTRSNQLPNGDISSQSTCAKKGTCGECGRANIKGQCKSKTHCRGC